jgi:lysophospholipase L1-like esterase
VTFSRRDFVTTITINSEGLRDRERPLQKPAGEFRVVALGDSFLEAYMMKDEETPTEKLRADLAGPGCAVDVVNGGTFGYSTDQEYLAYDRDLHRYQPDVVVLFVYHNDIPPLLWGPDKPVLDFSTEPPRVSNEPVTSRFPGGAVGAADQPASSTPVASPAPAPPQPFLRSEALALIQARLETASPRLRARLERVGLVSPLRPFDLNDELFLYARQPPEHLVRAIRAFQQTLGALKRRVMKDGARLLVAYIPARFEVNPEDWERTQARYRIGNKKFDPRSLVFRLMTAASQEDVEFLDLTDALKATRGWFARPYFDTDSHWNARGAAAGASAVAAKLRQLRWTPDCAHRD